MWQGDVTVVTLMQGGHKAGETKFPGFSGLFQSHKLTLLYVITTKSKCNNDLHQGSFHINSSNITLIEEGCYFLRSY